ncbi:hypothetical protein C2134_17585 [Chromobacterium sinusclupearum]|uniref:Uncharacterized protein n=1 Tax=Chromobacterium sinusclupearum TaxID=2077146 RepID=A0A2K4MKL7_9NEIS|nr:hypothetical protein C2134_17585 [Chromobacterium sinusclupearum]
MIGSFKECGASSGVGAFSGTGLLLTRTWPKAKRSILISPRDSAAGCQSSRSDSISMSSPALRQRRSFSSKPCHSAPWVDATLNWPPLSLPACCKAQANPAGLALIQPSAASSRANSTPSAPKT